jgi:uncharacterized protein (DUF58 family)
LDRLHADLPRIGMEGLPPSDGLPRHARAVLIGDMLGPLNDIHATVRGLSGLPVQGHILQVLDPAEVALPYAGRVKFVFGAGETALIPRVEGVRNQYSDRLAAQQQGLRDICAAAGWSFAVHHTAHPPEQALLALFLALAPIGGRK